MIEPRRAIVRPRALSPATGESLLLEDLVTDPAHLARRRTIQIGGGPGAGKTTALQHIRAVLADSIPGNVAADYVFLDEPGLDHPALHGGKAVAVFTVKEPFAGGEGWLTLRLAPWDEDDLLEYLLARHKSRCGAILAGLRQTDDDWRLQGIPELWVLTLDYLAGRPTVLPSRAALRAAFLEKLSSPDLCRAAGEYGLGLVLENTDMIAQAKWILDTAGNGSELLRLLRHGPLQHILAVDRIACDLDEETECLYLQARLPRDVVHLLADHIRNMPKAIAQLVSFLTHGEAGRQPMAASIYHELDRQWLRAFRTGKQTPMPTLTRAYLARADWPGVDMAGAEISEADLSFAELAGASLEGAIAWRTNFDGAVLTQANLRALAGSQATFAQAEMIDVKAVDAELSQAVFRQARLDGATFYRARLQQADFSGASLVKALLREAILDGVILAEADLTDADFSGAKFAGVDFRSAQIDGTRWCNAGFVRCNFEEVTARDADFSGADLNGALLTASRMPDANFAGANLRNTGLADIEWERADLRKADLRGASFHLGSSRSGLVGSPIAREGSMTGFYTDDFTEQGFKAPEEIRKANLRGADLRGANIEGVDFYLVDLRDAQYDDEQAGHFRACAAILQNRGG